MEPDRFFQLTKGLRRWVAVVVIVVGVALWWYGLARSPVFNSERADARKYVNMVLSTRAPDYGKEQQFARAYWQRYPDVRAHWLWGEQGTMGVTGARDHYRLHGRREGRIWGL